MNIVSHNYNESDIDDQISLDEEVVRRILKYDSVIAKLPNPYPMTNFQGVVLRIPPRAGAVPRRRSSRRCGRCKSTGHNRRNCPVAIAAAATGILAPIPMGTISGANLPHGVDGTNIDEDGNSVNGDVNGGIENLLTDDFVLVTFKKKKMLPQK